MQPNVARRCETCRRVLQIVRRGAEGSADKDLTRMMPLSETVNEALTRQAHLVVAHTLLTAIRVDEELLNGLSGISN